MGKKQGSVVHGNGCPCMGFNYSGCLHVGSNNTDLNFIVVAITNQQIQWSKNQFIIVTCGEIVINIILDIWLNVTEGNSYVSVFSVYSSGCVRCEITEPANGNWEWS